MMRVMAITALTVLGLGTAGCPPQPDMAAKPASGAATCEKAGQQCKLGQGVLGVCTPTPNGDGYECTPQH
jgi:hypothetical protein